MSRRLGVSDHAMIRYLERVGGFEIERLRAEIAAKLQPLAESGAGAVIVDGHAYVIAHNEDGASVVTVLPASGRGRQGRPYFTERKP